MAKKAGFNNGEKKQKSVHCSTERIRFIFHAVYPTKYTGKPRTVIEKFIHVGLILKNKQLSNLSNSGRLYTLHTLQYIISIAQNI